MAGLGTGNILRDYFRPNVREITDAEVQRYKASTRYGAKQLTPNMWRIQVTKNLFIKGGHAYITQIMIRRLGKWYLCEIPTDKKGQVKQITMAERLLDTDSGDRQGHHRSVMIDCSVDALVVSKPEDLARTYYWFLYPNETDVTYIDDSKTKIVEIMGSEGKGRPMRALISGGTAQQREKIAEHLKNNFTVREKRIINNCLIEIVPDNRSFAGCFNGQSDSKGNPIGVPRIQITSSHVDNTDTIVHEAIHALRQFDVSREPKFRAVAHYFGRDADLEESLTEAEEVGRETPFSRGTKYTSGYYHFIKIPNKTHEQMVTEDRVTITGDVAKGHKGRRVQRSLTLRYPATLISKLKYKGPVEAIDTYYKVSGGPAPAPGAKPMPSENIHLYKPDATPATDRLQDRVLKAEAGGANIIQWEDEKGRQIQGGSGSRAPAERLRRTMPKGAGGNGSKPKGRKGKSQRVGPYYHRGGRLSRRPV